MTVLPADTQLARIHAEIDDLDRRAEALVASCRGEEWQTRPATTSWSASECVQHIVTSNDAMLEGIDGLIQRGHAEGLRGTGPFRPGLLGGLLIWMLEPPYRTRMKTGASFRPAEARDPAEDLAALHASLDAVRSRLSAADGLALNRLTMVSPFAKSARYNLYTALALIPVHARRHLWQAEQTLARLRA